METQSDKIFAGQVPDEWIYRKIEMDYGLDREIEIVEEEILTGKTLLIQLKSSASVESADAIIKFGLETDKLEYYLERAVPVLLVLVDLKTETCYWLYVHEYIYEKLDTVKPSWREQKTVVLEILTENVWADSIAKVKEIAFSGPFLIALKKLSVLDRTTIMERKEFGELRELLAKLSETLDPAFDLAKSDIREIHDFLDETNKMLDGPFSLVKTRFYPGAWKVGLAYYEYTANSVGYTLYPIPIERNEVQIKRIDEKLRERLLSIDGITGYFTENPIKTRPRQHAIEFIEERLSQIIKYRLLDHRNSEALAREFIFAFSDKFGDQMGLTKKDEYALAEIGNGFYRHLPIWVDEAVRFMVREERNRVRKPSDCLYGKPYFDPSMLLAQIMPAERKELEQSVIERIRRGVSIPNFPIEDEKLPFWLFEEYHSYLMSSGKSEVRRLYESPDYDRNPTGGFIWGAYSPESVEQNLKTFFASLPQAYNELIERNFPQLKNQLALFGGATRAIVVFSVKDKYGSIEEGPTIAFSYLKSKSETGLHVDLYKKGQNADLEAKLMQTKLGDSLVLDEKDYELIGGPWGVLDFIYHDLPLLTFVYEELERAFRSYFREY